MANSDKNRLATSQDLGQSRPTLLGLNEQFFTVYGHTGFHNCQASYFNMKLHIFAEPGHFLTLLTWVTYDQKCCPFIELASYEPCTKNKTSHGCPQFKRQKLRVGGYTEKELKWFNYLRARAHPACEASCQGVPASSLCLYFVEASPTVEKGVSCYKANRLVASLPRFHSIRSSLAVRKICAAGK